MSINSGAEALPRKNRRLAKRNVEGEISPGLRKHVIQLRRSREVTQVCSRKVTHQNDHLAQGKCAAWMPRRARRPARGWDTKTLRAFGADETASFIPCPRARPVLRMGHSIGAQVGHFS